MQHRLNSSRQNNANDNYQKYSKTAPTIETYCHVEN